MCLLEKKINNSRSHAYPESQGRSSRPPSSSASFAFRSASRPPAVLNLKTASSQRRRERRGPYPTSRCRSPKNNPLEWHRTCRKHASAPPRLRDKAVAVAVAVAVLRALPVPRRASRSEVLRALPPFSTSKQRHRRGAGSAEARTRQAVAVPQKTTLWNGTAPTASTPLRPLRLRDKAVAVAVAVAVLRALKVPPRASRSEVLRALPLFSTSKQLHRRGAGSAEARTRQAVAVPQKNNSLERHRTYRKHASAPPASPR